MREIRRRTRVVGAFRWSTKRYMNIDLMRKQTVELQTA